MAKRFVSVEDFLDVPAPWRRGEERCLEYLAKNERDERVAFLCGEDPPPRPTPVARHLVDELILTSLEDVPRARVAPRTYPVPAPRCPACGAPAKQRLLDLATGRFECGSCGAEWASSRQRVEVDAPRDHGATERHLVRLIDARRAWHRPLAEMAADPAWSARVHAYSCYREAKYTYGARRPFEVVAGVARAMRWPPPGRRRRWGERSVRRHVRAVQDEVLRRMRDGGIPLTLPRGAQLGD